MHASSNTDTRNVARDLSMSYRVNLVILCLFFKQKVCHGMCVLCRSIVAEVALGNVIRRLSGRQSRERYKPKILQIGLVWNIGIFCIPAVKLNSLWHCFHSTFVERHCVAYVWYKIQVHSTVELHSIIVCIVIHWRVHQKRSSQNATTKNLHWQNSAVCRCQRRQHSQQVKCCCHCRRTQWRLSL